MLEILGKTNFDFMGKRRYAFMFSGIMVLLGIIAIDPDRPGSGQSRDRFCRRDGSTVEVRSADPDRRGQESPGVERARGRRAAGIRSGQQAADPREGFDDHRGEDCGKSGGDFQEGISANTRSWWIPARKSVRLSARSCKRMHSSPSLSPLRGSFCTSRRDLNLRFGIAAALGHLSRRAGRPRSLLCAG